MSEPAKPRRIRAQASPRDPRVMRFILDAPIQDGGTASLDGPDEDVPLAQALFAVDGVAHVQVAGETILVTCAPGGDWQGLKAPVAAAIRQVLDQTDRPLGDLPAPAPAPAESADADLLAAVTQLLDSKANPSIASHGGHISAESVEDGTVYLRMSGGCQGCAASAVTLRKGVETMLRAALPAIREIVDVTDHLSGETPYYASKPGQSPLFTRPVPAGMIGWDEGRLRIDPDYLAPCLGLTPDELNAGLAAGEIVVATERSPGGPPERTRVTVRSAQRAWAADVMPDGTAREIPPPRALSTSERAASTLPARVRAALEALPADKQPITYGRLARSLGMYAPGSIRKITTALEATMREDAREGRPFIAARAVGRGAGKLPGKGFFDFARALGRGPQPGETDWAFHQRHLTGSLVSD